MYTPEIQSKVAEYRLKAREGTLTREEMKDALVILRQGREAASTTSDKAKTKKAAAKKTVNSDDLLNELDGI